MRDFTNTSRSPRGVMTVAGSVAIIQPGETRSLDVSDAEADSWALSVGASAPAAAPREPAKTPLDAPPDDPALAAAELLAKADGMHVKTLQSAATKILGDATPGTKAEIIAALEEKATA